VREACPLSLFCPFAMGVVHFPRCLLRNKIIRFLPHRATISLFLCKFATMIDERLNIGEWSENVILADADYIDKVAFDLIVNFERMIGRRIPKADIARWIDCVALDGGILEGENAVQVVLLHSKQHTEMENFAPSKYQDELDDKAFRDHLGEFSISVCQPEDFVSNNDLFLDVLSIVCAADRVKRVMAVPNADDEAMIDAIRHALRNTSEDKRVTVFAMQPIQGGNFRQEILGYSLMNALGIRAEEIH